ncbi:hypothetical protein COU58_01555 [Candidatus Pacearchaeota archaeon CG10_big_fil_rev_8_21_14_0_10_32_42]|nr:MAG: hypothetical protein COU58_01555 [Candidatus Pacearchaeota archaeon CG10_big_fil_rev_8_21_14_0_10_32_42]
MQIKDCELDKVLVCKDDDFVIDVSKKLKKSHQKFVVVTKKNVVIGIISLTDINDRLVSEGKNAKTTMAKQIMTTPILTKDIQEPLTQLYIEMIKSNIFSCPVTKNKKLVGAINLKEVLIKLPKIKNGKSC